MIVTRQNRTQFRTGTRTSFTFANRRGFIGPLFWSGCELPFPAAGIGSGDLRLDFVFGFAEDQVPLKMTEFRYCHKAKGLATKGTRVHEGKS